MGGCSPTISSLRWWARWRSANTVVVGRQSGGPTDILGRQSSMPRFPDPGFGHTAVSYLARGER